MESSYLLFIIVNESLEFNINRSTTITLYVSRWMLLNWTKVGAWKMSTLKNKTKNYPSNPKTVRWSLSLLSFLNDSIFCETVKNPLWIDASKSYMQPLWFAHKIFFYYNTHDCTFNGWFWIPLISFCINFCGCNGLLDRNNYPIAKTAGEKHSHFFSFSVNQPTPECRIKIFERSNNIFRIFEWNSTNTRIRI